MELKCGEHAFRKEKKTVGKKNGEYAFKEKKQDEKKKGEYTFRRKETDEKERW